MVVTVTYISASDAKRLPQSLHAPPLSAASNKTSLLPSVAPPKFLDSLDRFQSPELQDDWRIPLACAIEYQLNLLQENGETYQRKQWPPLWVDLDGDKMDHTPYIMTPTPSPLRSCASTPARTPPANPSPTYELRQRLRNEQKRRKAKWATQASPETPPPNPRRLRTYEKLWGPETCRDGNPTRKRQKLKHSTSVILRTPLHASRIRKAKSPTRRSGRRRVSGGFDSNTHGMVTRSKYRRLIKEGACKDGHK